jgi:hypothetical protein
LLANRLEWNGNDSTRLFYQDKSLLGHKIQLFKHFMSDMKGDDTTLRQELTKVIVGSSVVRTIDFLSLSVRIHRAFKNSAMTFCITTFSITTLSINVLFATFSKMTFSITTLCQYAECGILLLIMLSIIMRSVVMLSVVAP